MYTLSKHKKLGAKGFKKFVLNLELFPEDTVRVMTEVGLLEDPVYMKWALQNKVEFSVFIDLDYEHVLDVMEKLKPRGLQTLMFALKNSKDENQFIENKLPERLQREYWDIHEITPVTKGQQDQARVRIMEILFDLEVERDIPSFKWKIPPTKILEGDHISIDDNGNYKMFYEDGKLALEGRVENKLREGFWKHYYPNGFVLAEGIYIQSEKQDEWSFYYADGRERSKGKYKSNLKEGIWKEIGKDGTSIQINYKAGIPV